MEKFPAQAASIRKERECLEAAGKVEKDKIKPNAEMRTGDQKAQEQVIRVEDEVGFVRNSCALERH